MNIVIVGVGNIGFHIASVLSKKQFNITLVDINEQRLEFATRKLDVATRVGSGTDWQLIEELTQDDKTSYFLAMTSCDEVNLAMCSMAKDLGYAVTIARLRNTSYFNQTRLDFERLFHVDHFIGPELLAAYDLSKSLMFPASLSVEMFAHGAICMRSFRIPSQWKKEDIPLAKMKLPERIIVGLIAREQKKKNGETPKEIIFPHGHDVILSGDEVTVIGETEEVSKLSRFFNLPTISVSSVVIAGASLIGFNLAKILHEKGIDIRIIEGNYEKCCWLAEQLQGVTVLYHQEPDLKFLESEKIDRADCFIACSTNDETNLSLSALAQKAGCSQIMAAVSNPRYSSIIDNFGISYVASPRISAANRILSLVETKEISSMISLYDNEAEVVEIKVSLDSVIAGIPLAALGHKLPKKFLISVIQNRGRIMIADGNKVISPGDTIIAISSPEHIHELHQLF